jgi:hypothetical protein
MPLLGNGSVNTFAYNNSYCWKRCFILGPCKGIIRKIFGLRWRYISIYSSAVGCSPNSNDVSTEVEESPLLRAVTKQRLAKTLQAGEDLARSDL